MARKSIIIFILAVLLLVPAFADTGNVKKLQNTYVEDVEKEYNETHSDFRASWGIYESIQNQNAINTNPFKSAFSFYLQIIIGLVGGALMALRFSAELVHALIEGNANGSNDELKRVTIRFVVHLVFALFGVSGFLAIVGITGGF